LQLDPRSVYYVLNPSKDLTKTQERFQTRFASQAGWQGVAGAAPTRQAFGNAVQSKDLIVYCGHGTGQAYFNATDLSKVDCKATVLLMGCSSGFLRDQGLYEPTGMALNYLIAGSPAVVANLWDVTDRDIDRFTACSLTHWLSLPMSSTAATSSGSTSLASVIATAREACTLPYLNGAAPVVYGLPVQMVCDRVWPA